MTQITVARAMTRKKTIKAQLDNIISEIQIHGAINNKKLHILSDEKSDVKKNHKEAIEKVKSLYQQFEDLKENYIKLSLAINESNLKTDIIIGSKPMKVAEALIYKTDIQKYLESLKKAYTKAVERATSEVNNYNRGINTDNLTEDVKKQILADVLYLVPVEKMQEVDKFLVEFMTELDGTLNEVNATTTIEVDID